MRKSFSLILLLMVLITVSCDRGSVDAVPAKIDNVVELGSKALVDRIDGFRGVKWGQQKEGWTIPHNYTYPYAWKEGIEYITWEKLGWNEVAGMQMTPCYGFYRDQFCAVHIATDSKEDGEKLFELLKKKYGQPVKVSKDKKKMSKQSITEYEWLGKKVRIVYYITSYNIQVIYLYLPIENKRLADLKKIANDF